MKYIIDVEKIEGTNLWKAKGFNTLVFDENGLNKLIELENEINDYYDDLRNEIEKNYKKSKSYLKTIADLREENEKLEHSNKSLKGMLKHEGELLSKAVKDKKELKEWNSSLEKDVKDFDNICMKLKIEIADLKVELKEYKAVCKVAFEDMEELKRENEMLVEKINTEQSANDFLKKRMNAYEGKNKELKEMYKEKCLEVESLIDTCKLPPNSDFGAIESKGENVPIEEVVCNTRAGSLSLYSDSEIKRLKHTIKSQKGMLIKQGKDISRLHKENKRLKKSIRYLKNDSWWKR